MRWRAAVAIGAALSGSAAGCSGGPSLEEQRDPLGSGAVVDDVPPPRRPPMLGGTGGVRTAPPEIEVDCASATYAIATGTGRGRCSVILGNPDDGVVAGWCGDSNSNVAAVDCTRGCGSSQGKGTCERR